MTAIEQAISIARNAPIPTWFRVGGTADRLAHPADAEELRLCLLEDPSLRVLGDGANLLVADEGVAELVVKLDSPFFKTAEIDASTGFVRAGAGYDLSKLIRETVAAGLVGFQGLIGVPATIGGALRMNAGGAFGQIADHVLRVHAVTRAGQPLVLERGDIPFAYRTSGLEGLIITSAEFGLSPGDGAAAREELKRIMAMKSATQPLASKTCGCVFRNPTLPRDIEGIGSTGDRVSAGLLIDRAGGKGMTEGGCRVSRVHANFVETSEGASASQLLALFARVRELVIDRFGVELETEVVVWTRTR